MKPFAFLECRLPGVIADDEYAALLRITGLSEQQIVRIWLDSFAQDFDFSAYCAVIVSGSPYGYGTPPVEKSEQQLQIEANIAKIVQQCLALDYPYLGICYGLQAVAVQLGLPLTSAYAEDITAVLVQQTPAGIADPIFSQLPAEFYCITGHSEALALPLTQGVLLSAGTNCPIQAVRFQKNIYGLQFHPEINRDSLEVRLQVYAGKYVAAQSVEKVRKYVAEKDISAGESLIRAFVQRYQRGVEDA